MDKRGGFGLGVVGDELEMDFVIFWVWMSWEMDALVLVGFQKVELKGSRGKLSRGKPPAADTLHLSAS